MKLLHFATRFPTLLVRQFVASVGYLVLTEQSEGISNRVVGGSVHLKLQIVLIIKREDAVTIVLVIAVGLIVRFVNEE